MFDIWSFRLYNKEKSGGIGNFELAGVGRQFAVRRPFKILSVLSAALNCY